MIKRNNRKWVGAGVIIIILLLAGVAIGQQRINWTTQADSMRGSNSQQFAFVCPANGTISGRLWGSGVYTDDSSICTAAVHAGVISAASGGIVTIEIRPGLPSYAAKTSNGVSSRAWGSFSGSFIVIGARGASSDDLRETINWTAQADSLRGRNGQRFSYTCPANGTISGRLWGSTVYTDDSSICTAAVHAGVISVASGGVVTVEIRPGAASYTASTSNGVTSRSYGSWGGSFVFVR